MMHRKLSEELVTYREPIMPECPSVATRLFRFLPRLFVLGAEEGSYGILPGGERRKNPCALGLSVESQRVLAVRNKFRYFIFSFLP